MPFYEYRRKDGTIFEIEQKITDDKLTVCPETGQKCRKVISKTGAPIFNKGCGGFYSCDYKKKGK